MSTIDQDHGRRLEQRGAEADQLDRWERRHRYYYGEVARIIGGHVSENASVLHVGCGHGQLLASLPSRDLAGIELSPTIAAVARRRHPHIAVSTLDPQAFTVDRRYDVVIVDQSLADLSDIQGCLESACAATAPGGRLILCAYNALWGPVLRSASALGLRRPTGHQNWLGPEDLDNLLRLSGFDPITRSTHVLLPLRVPGLNRLANGVLPCAWPLNHLCLNQLVVARPMPQRPAPRSLTCTVVIPTRNERGNIEPAVQRLPRIGEHTEVIFVDGDSTDGTADEIRRVRDAYPQLDISLIEQGEGRGKADAVRRGFAAARGDVLMILDADLTVPPEDLPRFFRPIADGTAEFVNGTRLVYPMEDRAMRFLNKCGNRFFSLLFTWLLGQRFRDTFCGTKVLRRTHWERIEADRQRIGSHDPFGDFDLIFGAVRADLKIVEVPVRYRARTYGDTNISRFRHGWLLMRMSWVAFLERVRSG